MPTADSSEFTMQTRLVAEQGVLSYQVKGRRKTHVTKISAANTPKFLPNNRTPEFKYEPTFDPITITNVTVSGILISVYFEQPVKTGYSILNYQYSIDRGVWNDSFNIDYNLDHLILGKSLTAGLHVVKVRAIYSGSLIGPSTDNYSFTVPVTTTTTTTAPPPSFSISNYTVAAGNVVTGYVLRNMPVNKTVDHLEMSFHDSASNRDIAYFALTRNISTVTTTQIFFPIGWFPTIWGINAPTTLTFNFRAIYTDTTVGPVSIPFNIGFSNFN